MGCDFSTSFILLLIFSICIVTFGIGVYFLVILVESILIVALFCVVYQDMRSLNNVSFVPAISYASLSGRVLHLLSLTFCQLLPLTESCDLFRLISSLFLYVHIKNSAVVDPWGSQLSFYFSKMHEVPFLSNFVYILNLFSIYSM